MDALVFRHNGCGLMLYENECSSLSHDDHEKIGVDIFAG